MLVRLVYASRAIASTDQEQLHAILRHSQPYNRTAGITGALCLADGMFMQLLEGGRSAVNALFQRISQDARHTEVALLHYEEITERRFASWSMAQVNVARLNPALLLKYLECAKFDPFAVSGRASLALFDELVSTGLVVGQA
jgi:hypothetical protein